MSGQALSMKLTSMLECSLGHERTSMLECSLGHERSRSARTKACMLAWALPMLVGLELEGKNTGSTGDSWGPRFTSQEMG